MEIVFFLTGIFTGAFGMWLYSKAQGPSAGISKECMEQKEASIVELTARLAAREVDLKHLQEKLSEQKMLEEQLREKFTTEFKNLANEILEEKTKKFTEQNKVNIDQILKPLQEKIVDFQKQVRDAYIDETKQRSSLQEQIKHLTELNKRVSDEAQALTKALKGEAKTQGNWGEIILESILEKSGLVKDREYFVQSSYTIADGRRYQPDVIVMYPGERSIVIDSKVSLTAYERYVSASTDEEKATALKEHLLSVKKHVQELSLKNYHDIPQIKTLDFVMMFLPIEPAYLIAMQSDPQLWSFAYEKKILLISPTNLIAALKLIESMWRQEYQSRHAEEIAQKSGDLYDKFVGLLNDLVGVGKQMDMAKASYEEAMNKLSTGKGNLIRRSEEIRKLGAKTKKIIPPTLLKKAGELEDEG